MGFLTSSKEKVSSHLPHHHHHHRQRYSSSSTSPTPATPTSPLTRNPTNPISNTNTTTTPIAAQFSGSSAKTAGSSTLGRSDSKVKIAKENAAAGKVAAGNGGITGGVGGGSVRGVAAAGGVNGGRKPGVLGRMDSKKGGVPPPSPLSPQRPGLERRGTTARTRYVEMLLSLDQIPRMHNIYASFFTWILLAGYIVFPATFTSLSNSDRFAIDNNSTAPANSTSSPSDIIEKKILGAVRNTPLLYVAAVCCAVGALGCIWLWWRWRRNYVWVINRIFLPSFMNSIAGLISTLVNIYSARAGQYSITAKITIIVTGACSVVTLGLFLLYNNLALERVKKRHEKETRDGMLTGGQGFGVGGGARRRKTDDTDGDGGRRSHDEGIVEMVKRKAHEPGLEPGSVV